MPVTLQFDKETAIKIADYLEQAGMREAAADSWLAICSLNPYDLKSREKFGDLFYALKQGGIPLGSMQRQRFILKAISLSLPTPTLRKAYFDGLERHVKSMPRRSEPGAVVLGVGAGRCGSTTLSSMLAEVPGTCSTHENPPLIFWEPVEEQLQFHFDRMRLLRDYYAVVFDAAHSWLNALDRVFGEFPETKVVGLVRDTQACVRSFLSIKGQGRGSLNHWATPGNGIWATSPGDPAYPSYRIPTQLASDPDAAKAALLERYVTEYNDKLAALAAADPRRILVVRTEELSNAATAARLSEFLGISIRPPKVGLNVGGNADSNKMQFVL